MKAGQTFTIEPMINAGHYWRLISVSVCSTPIINFIELFFASGVWRDRLWPDGWTAATADGKRSAQFEHTLLVSRA